MSSTPSASKSATPWMSPDGAVKCCRPPALRRSCARSGGRSSCAARGCRRDRRHRSRRPRAPPSRARRHGEAQGAPVEPDHELVRGVPPEQVVGTVGVEVAAALERVAGRLRAGFGHLEAALHLPQRDLPVAVAPHEIFAAVAAEIGDAGELPCRRHGARRRLRRHRAAAHLPLRQRPRRRPPHQIGDSLGGAAGAAARHHAVRHHVATAIPVDVAERDLGQPRP